jgi:L-phenylalanine/L-methionine N-acetyltransferase
MIRKITAADFDFIYNLYMHPQVNPYLLYELMDKETFRPIYADLLSKDIIYIFNTEGVDVGMFKLIRYVHRSDHTAYLGGVAVHPDFAGRGYGQSMMSAIIDFGRTLGLLRIELSTAITNHVAMRVYEKAGFVQEGVMQRYTHLKRENRFVDEVLMAYLY